MRECATGQGKHSSYVYVTKLINLRQQDEDIAGYTKSFKDLVADIGRLGDEKKQLELIFNALYVVGINQSQFKDQISRSMEVNSGRRTKS
jgi:hypothetical protein